MVIYLGKRLLVNFHTNIHMDIVKKDIDREGRLHRNPLWFDSCFQASLAFKVVNALVFSQFSACVYLWHVFIAASTFLNCN